MEENKNTKINAADYEDFEAYDIIQEVDLVSLNSTLLSVLMQMNPILAVTLQASLAGFSIEEILRMGEQSQVNENYLNYIKQAKQDEKDEWNLISRIKSYTSILITIFNSSNEVFFAALCKLGLQRASNIGLRHSTSRAHVLHTTSRNTST